MAISTSRNDPRLPRYIQVKDELLKRIADRIWKNGEALPGEEKLAIEFAISVGTMRKVMQSLVQDGVLERIHGKGTFVSRSFERTSMLRFVRFREPGVVELPSARILAMEVKKGEVEQNTKLGLGVADKTIYLHRSRSYGDEVVLVEHIWLPHSRFAKLIPFLQKESPPLLYPVYDSVCGVLVSRAVDDLSMDLLPKEDAKVFNVAACSPCMRIERSMAEHGGAIIEWRVSFVPADRFHYRVEIR
ncbi:MAG: GntR family transcriptional regulator [Polaromonas sp.]